MKKFILIFMLMLFSQLMCISAEKYTIEFNSGVYHITIPYSPHSNHIKFLLSENLVTNQTFHKHSGAEFTINTGFFDPKNEKTISFIFTDGILAESPLFNENLVNNPYLMMNWDKIANRPEFRVLKVDDKYVYDIANHETSYEGDLVTSAQGGPMLLPTMDLEKEFFVVKEDNKVVRESASVLHKCARTLIGLKGQDVHIFIVTDKNPMTIDEARDLCVISGLDKAMAFDGGSSTSFDYKNKIHIVSTGIKGDDTGRKLKSFMIFR